LQAEELDARLRVEARTPVAVFQYTYRTAVRTVRKRLVEVPRSRRQRRADVVAKGRGAPVSTRRETSRSPLDECEADLVRGMAKVGLS
jgi:hypothetical protein